MDIRNIAIIAHVDHGKTTLVDFMLKQTHAFRDNEAEMFQTTILDSNDLEREKGITILAKNTAVFYKNTKINIIDTPGHSDFSGEVERVINMADGAVLVIDSAEGPLPQTQFVLEKAFANNLKIIVVINKVDRKDARSAEVINQTEELFLRLAHHSDQLHFPILYAVGREGKVWDHEPENIDEPADLTVLFETILSHIQKPKADPDMPFKMQVSTLDFDAHKGTLAIGKILSGTIKPGQSVFLMYDQEKIGQYKIEEVLTSQGLKRINAECGASGDIVALIGLSDVTIGSTVTDPSDPTGLPGIVIEEPTLQIIISANTSPFAGREGKYCTAGQLSDRLNREIKANIGMKISPNPSGSGFLVAGRGELHLAILLENLRREGYELSVAKPEVIYKKIMKSDLKNSGNYSSIRQQAERSSHPADSYDNNVLDQTDEVLCEPYEEITIDIDSSFIGVITEEMGKRKAVLQDTQTDPRGMTRMVYKISSRNLLGFRGDIMTKTRGNGIFSTRIIGYEPMGVSIPKLRNGVFVSLETGKATAYSLENLQARGKSFITPGTQVYEGMIIGQNSRAEDIEINIIKIKKLTNMHSSTSDIAVQLDPPLIMSLEQCLDFIEDDELLEITPTSLRLRKKFLTRLDRVRAKRKE